MIFTWAYPLASHQIEMSRETRRVIAPHVQLLIRLRTINGAFRVLTLQACAYASRSAAIFRMPDSDLRKAVFSWVDEAFEIEDKHLRGHKEHLYHAFATLSASQARHLFTDIEPTHCPICGNKLVTAYTEPLVCERCMEPTLDALDDLVRATTSEWTPEGLRESYLNALKSVSVYDE